MRYPDGLYNQQFNFKPTTMKKKSKPNKVIASIKRHHTKPNKVIASRSKKPTVKMISDLKTHTG
jgi:hypothetical protein